MSTVEKSIRLYAWKTNYHTFRIVQGEMDSRRFNIQLFSTTIPVTLHDCHVCFYAVKPDGKKAYLECEILDADTGLVSVELSAQVCAVDGTVDCWIQVVSDAGTDLRFEGMNIEVGECDLNESAESSNDFGFLTTAIAEMRPATARANEAAARANASADNADRATAESDAQTAKAKTATTNAQNATTAANTAKANADKATTAANQATAEAEQAKANADAAAQAAVNAANAANTAKSNADKATTAANNAAQAANTAADNVRDAVSSSQQAAQSASQAATAANTAVSQAQKAVTDANNASALANSAKALADNATASATEAANKATYAANRVENSITQVKEDAEEFILEQLAQKNQLIPLFAASYQELEEIGDPSKLYILPDGFIYAFMETEVESGGPSYVNVIRSAVDSDKKTIFDGDGVKTGVRLSGSSGAEASAPIATYGITGFIKASPGQLLRVKNYIDAQSSACYIIGYDNSMAVTKNIQNAAWMMTAVDGGYGEQQLTTDLLGDFTWIRLSLNGLNENTIVTLDQPISEGGAIVIQEAWANTGHQFSPADCEALLAQLKTTVEGHAKVISSLEKKVQSGSSDRLTMFIAPNGDDSNDGLSAETPKKTVKACVSLGATRISAKRGVYSEAVAITTLKEIEIFPTDNNETYDVSVERQPIVFETVDYIVPSTMSTYNSIKKVAYSNGNNEQFNKVFVAKSQPALINDNYGRAYGSRYNATVWLMSDDMKTVCNKLKPVMTVAECEAEIDTFTYVDGHIYINANWTGVTKVVVPTNWGIAFHISNALNVRLVEVEARFAGSYNLETKNCAHVDLYKCAAKFTSYGSGFHPVNVNGTFNNCYATKNYDGFGVNGYGHTTYIDCVSEFNFDDGVSHHNGSDGTFIGGRYEGNGKGGNTPAYGAKVNIFGGLYKNNASFGIGYLYTSTHNPASGTVQGAVMVDNPIGIQVDANCPVTMLSCVLKNNTTERQIKGILTEYGTVNS